MIAKFSGTCVRCGHAIKKGEEMDYRNGKATHPNCTDSSAPDDQEELAERLGYKHYSWDELLAVLRRGMSHL